MRRAIVLIGAITLLGQAFAQQVPYVVKQASPKAALDNDLCDYYYNWRTTGIYLENATPVRIRRWYSQGQGPRPQGNVDYDTDTEILSAENIPGGGRQEFDPCYAIGGSRRPVAANVCKASLTLEWGQRIHCDDAVSPPGGFWWICGFRLHYDHAGEVRCNAQYQQKKMPEANELPRAKTQ